MSSHEVVESGKRPGEVMTEDGSGHVYGSDMAERDVSKHSFLLSGVMLVNKTSDRHGRKRKRELVESRTNDTYLGGVCWRVESDSIVVL